MSVQQKKKGVQQKTRGSYLDTSILPLIVFPIVVALSVRYIFPVITDTNVGPLVMAKCPAVATAATPYRLTYTGVGAIDDQLCGLVAFFHGLFEEPKNQPFAIQAVAQLAPVAAFPFVEGARQGRSPFVSTLAATIVWSLGQKFTGAACLPLFWFALVYSGSALRRGTISWAHGEALLFAWVVGFGITTYAMVAAVDPYITAFWQPFPLLVFAAYQLHTLVRRPSAHPESGHKMLQYLYGACFVASAVPHMQVVWPIWNDAAALKALFVPHVIIPGEILTIASGALTFMQWDIIFLFAGAFLATLWFAQSLLELIMLVNWIVVASAVLGPGAALSAIYMWREIRVGSP